MKKLFIHIPKNAGRTIHRSKEIKQKIILNRAEYIKPRHLTEMTQTMKKYGEHVGSGMQHARWRDIKPNITAEHQAFAIVRNPWSKVVSRHTFNERLVAKGNHKASAKLNYKSQSFEEFLEERHDWGTVPYYWHRAIRNWYPQLDHITDDKGNVRCDILRLETFDEDVVKYLNLSRVPDKRNVSNGVIENNKIVKQRDYKDFYNDKTIQIVADWYKDDIEYFGFDFDTGATKNTYYA